MNLGNPLGLLALLGALPLIAAYFLRRRQAPRKVSALFLWKSLTPAAAAGPRFERFRRERSLLLELGALLMAALFLANLRCDASGPRGHLVIVLDGSLSMNARGADGKTAAERGRAEALREIDRRGAGRVTVVEAGPNPRMLAGPEASLDVTEKALEAWRPAGPNAASATSLQLAAQLAGPGRPFVFFSDAMPPENTVLPETLRWVAVGEAAKNAGFVSAQRLDEGGVARLAVRVVNFSEEALERTVRFTPERGTPLEERVSLTAGEGKTLAPSFAEPGVVQVQLEGADALGEDDRFRLLPSPARRIEVALLGGLELSESRALRRVLSLVPSVTLLGEGEASERLEAALRFGPRASEAQVTIEASGAQRTYVGPFFTEKAHRVLEDVQLDGVAWTAGENPPGRALVRAGEAVLLSEETTPAGTRFHLNLSLARSNLQRTPAWPVLVTNLLRSASLRAPGFSRRHLSLGEEVIVSTLPGARWAVEGENIRRPLLGVGELRLPPLPVGRYTLTKDDAPFEEVEVLPLDAAESDLRGRSAGTLEPRKEASLVDARESSGASHPWPLMLLLGAVLANFALTRRSG